MKNNARVRSFAFAAFCAFALVAQAASAASPRFLHVKVEGRDAEKVTVNLPLSLAQAAVAMIPPEALQDGNIKIDDQRFNWQQLQTLWNEIKYADVGEFIRIEGKDENVVVRKEGEFLVIKTTERRDKGTQVDVKLPFAVVDALLSGPEGTLNLNAALQALSEYDEGHLVSIESEDETVHVWIDDQNEVR
jgi:hypothetical protein